MSPRYAAHVDANQPAIVKGLRAVGATVLLMHALGKDVPDILAGYRGKNYLMEIKNPERGRRKAEQHDDWHAAWNGQVTTVWTLAQALITIGFYSDEETTT